MTLTITKVSGVLFFLDSRNANAKSYFGANGSYQFSDNSATVTISIGGDTYNLAWGDLRVGTSTPPSVTSAKVLLNAILGT